VCIIHNMIINKSVAAKLKKLNYSEIGRELGVPRANVFDWINRRSVPDEKVIPLSEYTNIDIKGKWKHGEMVRCPDCNCVKVK
jgi:Bacteriophage CI repressor helix-turn-helix domain